MPLQIREESQQEAQAVGNVPSAAEGAALEAGRALDRQRMEARVSVLSLRVRRLRRLRLGIVPVLRWPGWVSVLMMIGGFAFLLPAAFEPNHLFSPLAAYSGQVMIGGMVIFALTLVSGATSYSLCQSREFALRRQARREGLELSE